MDEKLPLAICSPGVASRLVSGYEEWASQYKREAEQRLGRGSKPLQQLLAREQLGTLNGRIRSSPFRQPRSASEGALAVADADQHGGQQLHLQHIPDWLSAFDQDAHLQLLPSPAVAGGAGVAPRFPRAKTAPALRDMPGEEGSDGASTSSSSSSSSWVSRGDGAQQLESVASRLLQQSRQAIQNAQHTLQETASNCQANLQTLGALLQQVSQYDGLARNTNADSRGIQAVVRLHSDLVPRFFREPSGDDPGQSSSGTLALLAHGGGSPGPGDDAGAAGAGYAAVSALLEQLAPRQPSRRSLQDPGRSVAIVTTASLPWMTGTAVNPLLRAAYLANSQDRNVTLLLPWLSKLDQERVFPNSIAFDSPADQEAFVREWAQKRTGLACDFTVRFYPGRYAPEKGSILPVGDITQYIPDAEADVAVLEEPEHLSWYHHGRRWTDKFQHVVGVMHTNYLDYARREEGGQLKEALLRHINAWMCRIHCHKVIKLSDAVQALPREQTMFVHGVSPNFLQVGQAKATAAAQGEPSFAKGAYFLGKVLWAKGYTELLERLQEHAAATGDDTEVDVFGTGPDLQAVQEAAARRALRLHFNGPRDHADSSLQDYKVFINPSLSDVVATTTAEALAMGKFVVCADHPSNAFFAQFPNCLVYRTPAEFSQCLQHALHSQPAPLSAEQLRKLTWEDATERFLQVAELQQQPELPEQLLDNFLASAHHALTSIEALRVMAGAGAGTRDSPAAVTDYVPKETDLGGWFDDAERARRMYAAGNLHRRT